MSVMYVYAILNRANGKRYIGKTTSSNLAAYLRRKFITARAGVESYLYKAIRKYGEKNFIIFPLLRLENNTQLCGFERKLIVLARSQNPAIGYNLTSGGDGNSGARFGIANHFFGKTHSLEVKQHLSKLAKQRMFWRRQKGVPGPNKGRKLPSRDNRGERNPMFGKKHSEAAKQLIREKRLAFNARKQEVAPQYAH